MQKDDFPAFQFSISFSIHYENVANTTSRIRYDKSNDCKNVRWQKLFKAARLFFAPKRSHKKGKNCRQKLFSWQSEKARNFYSNRLCLILIAWIFVQEKRPVV